MPKKGKAPAAPRTPPLPEALLANIKYLNDYVEPSSSMHADAEHQELAKDAAAAIAEWAGKSDVNRHDLGGAGAVPPLVALTVLGIGAQRDAACHALSLLSFNNPIVYGGSTAYYPEFVAFDNIAAIFSHGGVLPLIKCLEGGSATLRQKAALTLSQMANNTDRRSMIAAGGAILPLVAMLRDGVGAAGAGPLSEELQSARQACLALGSICFCHAGNQSVVRDLRGGYLLEQLAGSEAGAPVPVRMAASYALRSLESVPSSAAPPPPPA